MSIVHNALTAPHSGGVQCVMTSSDQLDSFDRTVSRVGTAHQFLPFAGTIKPAVSERGRNLIVNPDNNSPSRRRFSLLPSHPSTNNLPNVRTLEECYVNSTHAPTAPHSGGVQCVMTSSDQLELTDRTISRVGTAHQPLPSVGIIKRVDRSSERIASG